jgi:hypothetical protein
MKIATKPSLFPGGNPCYRQPSRQGKEDLFMDGKGGKNVQRARKTLRGFVALMIFAGAMTCLGCSEDIEEVVATDVNNQSFAFTSGAVFNPALTDTPTTLVFSNSSTNFTLSSVGGTAFGVTTFGNVCTLTVTTSTYAIGGGPQMNDVIRLDPCDFDIPNQTLLIGNGITTATSSPAVPTGT